MLDEIKVQKKELLNSGVIAFLPGSRKSEITRLMPIYKEVASSLNNKKLLVVPLNLKNDIDYITPIIIDTAIIIIIVLVSKDR